MVTAKFASPISGHCPHGGTLCTPAGSELDLLLDLAIDAAPGAVAGHVPCCGGAMSGSSVITTRGPVSPFDDRRQREL